MFVSSPSFFGDAGRQVGNHMHQACLQDAVFTRSDSYIPMAVQSGVPCRRDLCASHSWLQPAPFVPRQYDATSVRCPTHWCLVFSWRPRCIDAEADKTMVCHFLADWMEGPTKNLKPVLVPAAAFSSHFSLCLVLSIIARKRTCVIFFFSGYMT